MKPQLNQKAKEQFLKDFGKNFKKIRKQNGLSQLELAEKINGDVSKISRIERGVYDFKISSLLILADALGVEASVMSSMIYRTKFCSFSFLIHKKKTHVAWLCLLFFISQKAKNNGNLYDISHLT